MIYGHCDLHGMGLKVLEYISSITFGYASHTTDGIDLVMPKSISAPLMRSLPFN